MTRPQQLLAALLATLVLAITSCTNGDDNDAPDPTPSPESEVEAAYLAYWEMANRLAETPDPVDPELEQRASGEALAGLRQGLASLEAEGQMLAVGPQTAHTVSGIEVKEDGTASLTDCDVDDSRLLGPDGATLDEDLTTTLWDIGLVRSGGTWRVDRFVRVDSWDGETDCK